MLCGIILFSSTPALASEKLVDETTKEKEVFNVVVRDNAILPNTGSIVEAWSELYSQASSPRGAKGKTYTRINGSFDPEARGTFSYNGVAKESKGENRSWGWGDSNYQTSVYYDAYGNWKQAGIHYSWPDYSFVLDQSTTSVAQASY